MLDALQILLTVSLLAAVAGVLIGLWPRRLGNHPFCAACGYDVFALHCGRCPECGTQLLRDRAVKIGRRRRRLRLALVCIVIALGAGIGEIALHRHLAVLRQRPVLLAQAIERSNLGAVERFLRTDRALVFDQSTSDGLPLGLAIRIGDSRIAQRLIDVGADVNAPLRPGWMPLHQAAVNGDFPLIDMLLRAGADVRAVTSNGQTALHLAVHRTEAVTRLLDAQAPVDARDSGGSRPLHAAAASWAPESPAIVRALLFNGASVDHPDDGGLTPLHCAARRGNEDVIRALLDAGADPLRAELGDSIGKSGFLIFKCMADRAVDRDDFEPLQRVLRRAPSACSAALLHHAVRRGDPRLVEALLDASCAGRADVEFTRPLHRLPHAHSAVFLGEQRQPLVNSPDASGRTPIQVAEAAGNQPLVRLLVSRGASTRPTSLDPVLLNPRRTSAMLDHPALHIQPDVWPE